MIPFELVTLMARSIAKDPLPVRIQTYNSLIDSYGRGAGIGFYDQVVMLFVEHLTRAGEKREALHAVQRAQHSLKIEPGGQLDREITKLLAGLQRP